MSEDLISNNFIDNVDRAIVKRNVILSKIALSLSILYVLVRLFDWYIIFKELDISLIKGASLIFAYKIMPIIDFVIFIFNIYGYLLILKAYKSINVSLDKSEASLLTLGFKYFYRTNTIVIFSFSISIIASITNHLL